MPRTPKKTAPETATASATDAPAAPLAGPASLPAKGAEDALYLVDLSGYVFRAYHALPPLSSTRGEPTHAVLGTVNMLQKIIAERRPHRLAMALDSKGRTFRHDLDARYKATRPEPPPDLSQQMARVHEIARAWEVACFRRDGLEADDLIAAVTTRAVAEGLRVVIVSADKDLMQLVHDSDLSVVLWDSMRDKVYGPLEVVEKLGVRPSRVRDYLALTGDTSDNVPGVPGVGPKTASDLLEVFGTLEGIYEGIERVSKPKIRENLRLHEQDARVSQRLVTLDAATPIEWDLQKLAWSGGNLSELRRLYTELEFRRQLTELEALAKAQREDALASAPAAPKPASAPSAHSAVLSLDALSAVVAAARERKRIGLAVHTSSGDANQSDMIGLSLASDFSAGHYVPIAHRYLGAPAQLPWEQVRASLGALLADPDVTKVGYDLKRAEIVLTRHGAPLAGPSYDVLLAAYLLEPEMPSSLPELCKRELGIELTRFQDAPAKPRAPTPSFDGTEVEHAASLVGGDGAVVLALAERFDGRLSAEGLMPLFRDVETPLEYVLAAMEMHGVLVDFVALESLGRDVDVMLRELDAECKRIAGKDFILRSRDQLEKILFDELRLPVVKRTPKGGRSTDADVLEALAEQHPLPARILEYRELDKLKGTYIDALPKCVHPRTGRIHTRFDQAVAATGRLSSSDPNLQNIPRRTELGRKIRAAFVAPPGHVVLSADYSQIELRVLAHLSQDPELVDAFASAEDVHARTAALIFDKARSEVTADERRAAKTINFGVIYGMGEAALAKQLGIAREQATRFIAAYFERYAGVARFMEHTVEGARQGDTVRTLLGRRRFLPNLHSANRALRFEAERVARNTPIQGTAADILKMAMVAIGRDAELARLATMVLTVHDELVFEVPEAHAAEAGERIRAQMGGAMRLAVPLVVDVGWGKSWADAH